MASKKVKAATTAAIVALGVLSSPSADSAIFVKIKGIEGDVTTKGYENSIGVLSWSWGVESGDRGPCVKDVLIEKATDRATAKLLMSVARGDVIPEARLSLVRTGSEKLHEYLTLDFKNAQIVAWYSDVQSDDDVPTERLTLNFEEVTGTYRPQDDRGGAGAKQEFVVDTSTSKCR